MRYLNIILIHHSISESCINLLMPEYLLHLFNRHALLNCSGCHNSSKLMWVYLYLLIFLLSHLNMQQHIHGVQIYCVIQHIDSGLGEIITYLAILKAGTFLTSTSEYISFLEDIFSLTSSSNLHENVEHITLH